MEVKDQRAGWVFPQVGQRVRLTESCPWPERVGMEATIVAPPADGTYPQPARWEVLVFIDNDPFHDEKRDAVFGPRDWSCVMSATSCEVLTDAAPGHADPR